MAAVSPDVKSDDSEQISVRMTVAACTPRIRCDELRRAVRLVSSILSANFCISWLCQRLEARAGTEPGGSICAELTRGFDLDQVKNAAVSRFGPRCRTVSYDLPRLWIGLPAMPDGTATAHIIVQSSPRSSPRDTILIDSAEIAGGPDGCDRCSPLSMAIAVASGVSPERGLYAAVIGGFLVSALGGSRYQIGGPAGAFIVLVAATVADSALRDCC